MPNAFGEDEINQRWEKFWSTNGERLIWSSWIENYSDYINPDYRKLSNAEEETPRNTEKKNFSFDRLVIDAVDELYCAESSTTAMAQPPNNETEIVVSSCSPAANSTEMAEDGWNPLSPASVDETWHTHRMPVVQDIENLLSPRCESVTSSIPLTIGTTDSMTNVTHMTVSSYDFGGSSRVTSDSSELTPSSPDIGSSSVSLSSQLLMELGDDAKLALIGEDDAMDSDQHWHILWQKHFQEQYAKQYKQYVEMQRQAYNNLSLSFHADSVTTIDDTTFYNGADCGNIDGLPYVGQSTKTRLAKRKKNRKLTMGNLPKLVNSLNLQSSHKMNDEMMTGKPPLTTVVKSNENNESLKVPIDTVTEIKAMSSMGLPMSFGKKAYAMKRRYIRLIVYIICPS